MTNYTVTMDDSTRIEVKAWSAADAIQSALTKHLGHRVKACHSGYGSRGLSPLTGHIDYEIPRHDPVASKPVRPKKSDDTLAMFDPEEIRKESEAALYRAGKKQKAAGKL